MTIHYRIIHSIIITLLLPLIIGIIASCDRANESYKVTWHSNRLFITMSQPTVWNNEADSDVELSNVMEDVHDALKSTELSGTVSVLVRFERPETDKYGNETITYDDHLLAEIPISEAKKFKSGKYLDMEYGLKDKLIRVVTEPESSAKERTASTHETLRVAYLSDGTKVYLAPGDSLAEKYTSSAPVDSIDLTVPGSDYDCPSPLTLQLKQIGAYRQSKKTNENNNNRQPDSSSVFKQLGLYDL